MQLDKEFKKAIKQYFKNKYENVNLNEDDEIPNEHKKARITNLLLRIKNVGKYIFNDDMQFIIEFNNEINRITQIDEEQGKLIYTRTGYYKLNDGKKTSGYDGAKKADKYYINNVFEKDKVNRLEQLINYYFLNVYTHPNRQPDKPFVINQSNCILSRDINRWEYKVEKDIRADDDFKHLLNTLL